jgi:hypothetical protein
MGKYSLWTFFWCVFIPEMKFGVKYMAETGFHASQLSGAYNFRGLNGWLEPEEI